MKEKIFSGTTFIETALTLVGNKHLMTSKVAHRFFMRAIMAGFIVGIFYTMYVFFIGLFDEVGTAGFHIWGKIIASFFFGNALVFIYYTKSELLTSNMMLSTIGIYYGKITYGQASKILSITLIGNFVGGLVLALIVGFTTIFNDQSLDVIESAVTLKTSYFTEGFPGYLNAFMRAIFCNFMINIAMLMVYSGHVKDEFVKVIIIWVAVFIFAVLGLEHVVANLVFFTIAFVEGVDFNIGLAAINIVVAFVGNFIGGGILIGLYYAYLNDSRKFEDVEKEVEKIEEN